MGELKNYYTDYLSSEDFDLMFDDEYELWLKNRTTEEIEEEKSAYEESLSWGK
jgi:hypothetical protein